MQITTKVQKNCYSLKTTLNCILGVMILVGILPVKNVIIQKVLLLLLQSPVRKWNIKQEKKSGKICY